jgi:cytochrome c551/c552
VAPALNAADLFDGSRLSKIGWAGTVEDYLRATTASGRPIASQGTSYPNRMPTWSDKFGGPLREDQINSLVSFIVNWKTTALAEAAAPPTPAVEGFGTDITKALPAGDPQKGEALATAKGCVGCHITATVGPAWLAAGDVPGIGTRAQARFKESDYTGKATSAEQFLVEAIVQSNASVAPGFNPGIMTQTLGQSLSAQDVADLVAYLLTLK